MSVPVERLKDDVLAFGQPKWLTRLTLPRRLHWTRLDQCLSCLERVGVWLGCLSSKCREPFDQGHLISNNALRLHYKSERKRDATPLKLQQMLHRVLSIGARQFRIGSQEVTLISQSYSRLSSFSISSATLDHSSIRADTSHSATINDADTL